MWHILKVTYNDGVRWGYIRAQGIGTTQDVNEAYKYPNESLARRGAVAYMEHNSGYRGAEILPVKTVAGWEIACG